MSVGLSAVQPSAYSFRAIAHATADFLVDVDSGLLTNLRKLCTAPGALIASQLKLREHVFRDPLRLFFLVNVVFFLLAAHVGLFQFSLDGLTKDSELFTQIAQQQQEQLGLSQELYEERFDSHLAFRIPTFFLLLVPLIALAAKLFDRRQAYGVHLMASLYAVSWILLSWSIGLAVADTLFRMAGVTDPDIKGLSKLVLLTVLTMQWFVRVQVGGYGRQLGAALVQGALLTLGWVGTMAVYGLLMFWLTWALLPAG